MISYLPLSHIAAQMMDIHAQLSTGLTIHFAQPDALKGSLKDTLKACDCHMTLAADASSLHCMLLTEVHCTYNYCKLVYGIISVIFLGPLMWCLRSWGE